MLAIPALRRKRQKEQSHLWLHSEFEASLGYMETSCLTAGSLGPPGQLQLRSVRSMEDPFSKEMNVIPEDDIYACLLDLTCTHKFMYTQLHICIHIYQNDSEVVTLKPNTNNKTPDNQI